MEAGTPAGKPTVVPTGHCPGVEKLPRLGGDLFAQLLCTCEAYLLIPSLHPQALLTQEGGRPATPSPLPMTRPLPPPRALPSLHSMFPCPRQARDGVGLCWGMNTWVRWAKKGDMVPHTLSHLQPSNNVSQALASIGILWWAYSDIESWVLTAEIMIQ